MIIPSNRGDEGVDTKKLDKWAELLLDTGKRNNLINFKDTKASTAEVLFPDSEALFAKLDSSTLFEVFDPKLDEEEASDEAREDNSAEPEAEELQLTRRDAFFKKYRPMLRRQNQALLYNLSETDPIAALKNISKKAKEYLEETGVNVAYLAFGFIHWKDYESSRLDLRAPVLLVPIVLDQASAISPYTIKPAADELIVNPTFAFYLNAEYGIDLPEYADEPLSEYLGKIRQLVTKLKWTVTDEAKIGIFSFLKINMYRDLKDNAAAILANRNVRLLLGEAVPEGYAGSEEAAHSHNPLISLHNVVDADSSQIEAIEMAKSGRSFVLQGPPGTGKSQTITNIIAECLSDGKKVLFVSEKLAALNVVYEKLKQAGLSEFCLELHSHKANKKTVIADLCHTLRAEKTTVSSKADAEIALKEKNQQLLDTYAEELHRVRPVIGKSLYQLYEAHAAFRHVPDVEWQVPSISDKGEDYLLDTAALLEQYVRYIPTVGFDYAKNPWYGYRNPDNTAPAKQAVKADLSEAADCAEQLIPVTEEIAARYDTTCSSYTDAENWLSFLEFAAASDLITPAVLTEDGFSKVHSVLEQLNPLSAGILANQAVLDSEFDSDLYKLDGSMMYKQLTRQFDSPFSRLFSRDYKQIITGLRLCRRNGKKPSYQEAVAAAERLAACQRDTATFAELEQPIAGTLGSAYNGIRTDWNAVLPQMEQLRTCLDTGVSPGLLCTCTAEDYQAEKTVLSRLAGQLRSAIVPAREACRRVNGYFDPEIWHFDAVSCQDALAKCGQCLDSIDKLDNWCRFRSLLAQIENAQALTYIDCVVGQNIAPDQIVDAFKKRFYYQWIDSILFSAPALSGFSRIAQDQAIDTFRQKDTQQFTISKAQIRAELSAKRPSLDMVTGKSAVSILLREGEKKRKLKSIRTLLAETGELVQVIKPCFLMSPLSVSTFLSADAVHFDVVVFDEASQIFPQDAIGAIYRADQLIVVGDSKQMPPSNFFNSTVESDDTDEETGDVTDFESILDLCSTSMPQLRLRWHYRSRFEQLITFSNRNFYDNDLVTFPSSKPDGIGVGVDYFHVDGIFDRKSHTNRKEAEFVVDLIYDNIEKYPDRSLGVVAFSVAQQDLIDKLLSKRRQASPEKEPFFSGDAKEPFFIKNLETVQGDERDTIIFSVAYGMDAQGRLLHNFGPLNRIGGERRLNVAVTRAKCNVQLVSSMHHTDIDLKRTSAEGARLLREYLDYAENGNIALDRSISVQPFEQYDSDFEQEVYDFLKSKGFDVDTQIGCSGFRIDIGLKRPGSSDYVLAIECDGAAYHSSKNARDRDRLRQEILERMGWQFYRVWSTDWFRNKAIEQQLLYDAARNAVQGCPDPDQSTEEVPEKAEDFEEIAEETHFSFPQYAAARPEDICFTNNLSIIRSIVEAEAPISEEWLLKRISYLFGKDKVTKTVWDEFNAGMVNCRAMGIVRRNGFLYLSGQEEFHFRGPGDYTREIRYIAPEELADGMREILRQNITADKASLYHTLALCCGVTRAGKAITDHFDNALDFLLDEVSMDGDVISLKGR